MHKLEKIIEEEISLEELDPRIYSRKYGPDWMALYLTQKLHNWRIIEQPTACGDNLAWVEFGRDIYGDTIGVIQGCLTHHCPIETIWKREE